MQETPHSGDTQTTPILEKDRISVNRMDIDLPELAELKARGRFGCVWRAELPDQTSVAVKIFLMQVTKPQLINLLYLVFFSFLTIMFMQMFRF